VGKARIETAEVKIFRSVAVYTFYECKTNEEIEELSLYSKLIGWVMEGRKCAAAGGDQAFLLVVPL